MRDAATIQREIERAYCELFVAQRNGSGHYGQQRATQRIDALNVELAMATKTDEFAFEFDATLYAAK